MAYDIHYGGNIIRSEQEEKRIQRKATRSKKIIVIVIMIVVMICVLQIPAVQNFLIPGNKAVTKAAYYEMIDNLKSGQGVQDAVTAFCQEIMDHAQSGY